MTAGAGLLLLALALTHCGRPAPTETGPDVAERLFAAARSGDLDKVRELLQMGVPVDVGDRYDATPLAMAAGRGHAELVSYLLDHGADPNHPENFFGSSPLDQALSGEHYESAALLLAGGADDRETALDLAVARKLPELARAAVASGAIHESRLVALRANEGLDPAIAALLAVARSRPDPPPPNYSPTELRRFTGRYEGWDSDRIVEITAQGSNLSITVNDGELLRLEVVSDRAFRTVDGSLDVSFWGRAGTIEQVALARDGEPAQRLRRSVAEPVGPSAYTADATTATANSTRTAHWPGFRGTNASGIADGHDLPVRWDVSNNESILWRADLPGLGNSSPIVWGDRIFVTTAIADGVPQDIQTGLTGSGSSVDEEVEHRWEVLAFDKHNGERLWNTVVGRDLPLTRRHFKASQANSTPVTDGRRLVAVFPTAGLVCLDLDGEVLWKRELGGLNAGAPGDPGMHWGFASSPVIHRDRVILQVDVHEGAYLAAWDLDTGEPLWRTERDVVPSWATPALLSSSSGDELVVNGSTIAGYDPQNGRRLWSLGPNSELVIATPVVGDGVVYVSAGYAPVKPIYAVRAGTRGDLRVDPSGEHERLLWSHGRGGAYMPTPLLYRGVLYVVHHNGRIVAYDALTGAAIYKSRFSRSGTFTASPVAANGRLYISTEEGLVYVIEAGPVYRELAVNEIGEPLMATPAISDGILLLRTPRGLIALGAATDG